MTGTDVVELAAEAPPDPAPASPVRARALSEATVVARAQDGDVDAFETLVRTYEAELFRLAFRMTNDRGEAEDAVQDSFVLAWRRLPGLQDPVAFRAWIVQLTTRQCLSVIRRRDRRRTTVLDPGTAAETLTHDSDAALATTGSVPDPHHCAETGALRAHLQAALAGLDPELRACWVLKELHEMSYPEIAYAVGVPVSTVRGRIARARQNLAKGLASWR